MSKEHKSVHRHFMDSFKELGGAILIGILVTPIIMLLAFAGHMYNQYRIMKAKYATLFELYEKIRQFLDENPAIDALVSAAIPGI